MVEYLNYLWPWQLIFSMIVFVALFFLLVSTIRLKESLCRLSTPKSVRAFRFKIVLADLFVLASIILLSVELWMGKNNPNWKFFVNAGVLIYLFWGAVDLIKLNRILFKSNNEVMAISFELQSERYSAQGNHAEAIKCIETLCDDLDPDEPQHWLKRSLGEKNLNKAKEYVEIAEKLIKEKELKSEGLSSLLEYCKGIHLIAGGGNTDNALEHFNKSLELVYDKKRDEYIRKVVATARLRSIPVAPNGQDEGSK